MKDERRQDQKPTLHARRLEERKNNDRLTILLTWIARGAVVLGLWLLALWFIGHALGRW